MGRKRLLAAAAVVHRLFPHVFLSNTLRRSIAFEASCTTGETSLLLQLSQTLERKRLQRFRLLFPGHCRAFLALDAQLCTRVTQPARRRTFGRGGFLAPATKVGRARCRICSTILLWFSSTASPAEALHALGDDVVVNRITRSIMKFFERLFDVVAGPFRTPAAIQWHIVWPFLPRGLCACTPLPPSQI